MGFFDSVLNRLVPGDQFSRDDKKGLLSRGLIEAGLTTLATPTGTGSALMGVGRGLLGGLDGMQRGAQDLEQGRMRKAMFGQQEREWKKADQLDALAAQFKRPDGSFDMDGYRAAYMALDPAKFVQTQDNTPADIRTLQILKDNPELLDINNKYRGTFGFDTVLDAQGREVQVARNSRTGAVNAAPLGGGGVMPPANSGGDPQMDALAQAANAMIKAGVPPEQVDAFLMQSAQASPQVRVNPPAMRPAAHAAPTLDRVPLASYGGGDERLQVQGDQDRAFAAAEQARLVKEAELNAQLRLSPELAAAEAEKAAAAKAATIEAETRANAAKDLPKARQAAQQMLATIDKAIAHPGREIATGKSGMLGLATAIPGDAKDFSVLMKQMQGKVFLEAYQSLKGSGTITEIEGLKAEEAIARLNLAQTDEEFLAALNELREVVVAGQIRAEGAASPASAGGGSGIDALLNKWGN